MNFQKLASELGIDYQETGRAWVSLACPFCGDTGTHLGFNTEKEYFNCFKCGWHPLIETIAVLADCSKWQAADAVGRAREGRHAYRQHHVKFAHLRTPQKVELPYGVVPLSDNYTHLAYLNRRGFSPDKAREIAKTYNLWAAGPIGDYKLRIIFPIYHYSRLVSFTGRDITDKSKMRYKACKKELECRSLKHCLYAADLSKEDYVVVTEGPLDAIRLGPGAVATFGTEFTWQQVRQLADRWRYRFVAFDPDPPGERAAKRLCAALSALPGKTFRISLNKTDPGGMNTKQVKIMWDIVHRHATDK